MRRLAAVLALSCAAARADGALAEWPETVAGVAEARVVGEEGRMTTRLAFAAAIEPMRLRIEVVRAGSVQAVIHADERRLVVLAPGSPSLLFEGAPTREVLEQVLGLPFCPAEVFLALRGGNAPPARCGGSADEGMTRDAEGLEIVARSDSGSAPASLRFSRFRRIDGNAWPMRAVLDSDLARATLDIQALDTAARPPSPLSDAVTAQARRVDAAAMARYLGVAAPAERAPPAAGGGRR